MRFLFVVSMLVISMSVYSLEFEAGPSGGAGGTPFLDNPPSDYLQINSIKICSGSVIDSIETTYEDSSGNIYSYGRHGGGGGSCSTLFFWAGEYITTLSGKYASKIDSITIKTNFGRVLTKGGSGSIGVFNYTANAQFSIAGLKGRKGSIIDAIGVVYFKTY